MGATDGGAEVEISGNWVSVSIMFGGVKSHGGVEERIGVRQWNLEVRLRGLWRFLLAKCVHQL